MSFLTPIKETRRTGHGQKTPQSQNIQKITPNPAFVIKTKIFNQYKNSPPGTKLFINVSTHPIVPLPPSTNDGSNFSTDARDETFQPEIIFPLIMENKWEIPILTSPTLRNDKDKKGNHSLIIDCIINEKPMRWCIMNNDLKLILIEWCFDAVEFRIGENLIIDRETVVLPKRTYMGTMINDLEVDLEILKNDKKDLVELNEKLSKNETFGLLEAKRYMNEESELDTLSTSNEQKLPSLFGINEGGAQRLNSNGSTSPEKKKMKLIEEIDSSSSRINVKTPQITSKPTKNGDESNNQNDSTEYDGLKPISSTRIKKDDEIKKPSVNLSFEFTSLKESETAGNYKKLFKIGSRSLSSGSDYNVKFDNSNQMLIVSTTNEDYDIEGSKLEIPVGDENGLQGEIKSFYINPEKLLYIYVK